jgi:hypothetical protein
MMSWDDYLLTDMPLGDDEEDVEDDDDDSGDDDDDMSETETTEKGALSQIGDSFKMMLAGFVCFIVSWVVLYCGATRVQWDKVFKDAKPVEQVKK